MNNIAPLAITMGDASGIGPEIVAKTLAKGGERALVFGSRVVMEDIVRRLGLDIAVRPIAAPGEARFQDRVIEIVEATRIEVAPPFGAVNAIAGQAAFDTIVAAVAAAKAGEVSGIVTAPINKEAMASAGIGYPGHTEILADYGGAERVAMMLANDDIRTVLVTIHTSLRKAIDQADFDAQMCGHSPGARRREGARNRIPAGGCRRSQPACRRRAAFSATKRSGSSARRSKPRGPKVSTRAAPGLATPSTCRPGRAASTSSWRSITIRV